MQLFKDKNAFYRIPALIKCDDILVACVDKRYYSAADNPNKIDKVIKRSLDNGLTWSDEIIAVKMPGDSINNGAASIDPQLLYNPQSKTLFLLYSLTPAGIGLFNSKLGSGYSKNNLLLFDKQNNKFLVKNNSIINLKTKEISPYTINDNTLNNGESVLLNSVLKIHETSYLMLCTSQDQGLTWSKPRCLNPMIKQEDWAFIGAGPGIGQVITYKNKTRLLFPIYYTIIKKQTPIAKVALMYSDDNGKTFRLSKSPRLLKDNNNTNAYHNFLTEGQIVTANNIVYLIQRNHHSAKKIIAYPSTNGGESFAKGFFLDIAQPISQICALNYQNGFVIVNPLHSQDRKNGTITILDKTFHIQKQIPINKDKDAYFGYSSGVIMDNELLLLYENTDQFKSMELIKIPLT